MKQRFESARMLLPGQSWMTSASRARAEVFHAFSAFRAHAATCSVQVNMSKTHVQQPRGPASQLTVALAARAGLSIVYANHGYLGAVVGVDDQTLPHGSPQISRVSARSLQPSRTLPSPQRLPSNLQRSTATPPACTLSAPSRCASHAVRSPSMRPHQCSLKSSSPSLTSSSFGSYNFFSFGCEWWLGST
jgi:hypothetical protein